jgi:hypothetical protein
MFVILALFTSILNGVASELAHHSISPHIVGDGGEQVCLLAT